MRCLYYLLGGASGLVEVNKSLIIPRFGFRLPGEIYEDEPAPPAEPAAGQEAVQLVPVHCPNPNERLARVTCGDRKVKKIEWIRVNSRSVAAVLPCEDREKALEIQCVAKIDHRQHYNREDRALVGQTLDSSDVAVLNNFMMLCDDPVAATVADADCLTRDDGRYKCVAVMTTELAMPSHPLAWICTNEIMLIPQLGYVTRMRIVK